MDDDDAWTREWPSARLDGPYWFIEDVGDGVPHVEYVQIVPPWGHMLRLCHAQPVPKGAVSGWFRPAHPPNVPRVAWEATEKETDGP